MTVKCLNVYEKAAILRVYKLKLKTQQELADDYGVSKDTIYRVIRDDRAEQIQPIKKGPARDANGRFIAKGNGTFEGTVTVTTAEVKAAPVKQPFIWNANSKFISITQGRETWNADKDHPNFKAALELLIQDKVEEARNLINIERAVKEYIKGDVRIADGTLFYQDIELRSGLVDRILESMNKGEDFEFYIPFLENLLENPSQQAVSRLFDFLVANDIEITKDGYFIGWKIVNANYTDCRTGKFNNAPGEIVKMPRSRVDDNDNVTCSSGLHVCSKGYIGHFSGHNSKVVSVKVHPRDVVSIPVDYGDAKMRTCQYEVLEDVTARFKDSL